MNFIGNEASQNSDQTIDAAAHFRHWVTERTGAIHDPHWILVERDVDAGERHLVVGPYRGASAAHEAMIDSLLLDSIAEESCFDMYTASHVDLDAGDLAGHVMGLVDENEPAHHARMGRNSSD